MSVGRLSTEIMCHGAADIKSLSKYSNEVRIELSLHAYQIFSAPWPLRVIQAVEVLDPQLLHSEMLARLLSCSSASLLMACFIFSFLGPSARASDVNFEEYFQGASLMHRKLLIEAMTQLQRGKYQSALTQSEFLIGELLSVPPVKNSRVSVAYFVRGQIHALMGNLAKASADLNASIFAYEWFPDSYFARSQLSIKFAERQDNPGSAIKVVLPFAIEDMEAYLHLSSRRAERCSTPKCARANHSLAFMHYQNNQPAQACFRATRSRDLGYVAPSPSSSLNVNRLIRKVCN